MSLSLSCEYLFHHPDPISRLSAPRGLPHLPGRLGRAGRAGFRGKEGRVRGVAPLAPGAVVVGQRGQRGAAQPQAEEDLGGACKSVAERKSKEDRQGAALVGADDLMFVRRRAKG